ncbi:hypothetical protein PSI9734_00872 [Pseudidiomarina piscicola]|uniref:Outer membrane protein beta-barrel domain-containing protein n=1 Tax=Pseudidiomarina piscicola TaxID=2614830 RepID=A0A6S6WMX1_9GAMM|nr:hypothetical protein [Pseudidiomarina piscicola]CAB0150320.1 hypothetical protein PSI9734_00872 [Pseudidiomarina piscicola]VZT39749.1 hypothetical protein PSI9734_00872 [Pseudomonas aeruginosa]
MKTLSKVMSLSLVLTGMIAVTPAIAQSQDNTPFEAPKTRPAFNFLSVGVADHDDSGDSLVVEGSYEFNSPWFISGYLRDGDDGPFGNGRDAQGLKFGRYVWLNHNLVADFSGRFGHVDFGQADSAYWGVEGNLRTRIDRFELYAGLGWVDYTDAGSDNQYQLGGRFYITPEFAVGARYQDSEFGDGLRLEASYHF